jgi:hypothetical protein
MQPRRRGGGRMQICNGSGSDAWLEQHFIPIAMFRGWVLQVIPTAFAGKKEIVPLEVRSVDDKENVVGFKYRQQSFLYNSDVGCFDKLKYPTSVCSPLQPSFNG